MSKKQKDASPVDVVEHRAAPRLNHVLGQEEKEKILLPSVLNEGSAGIDVTLQVGISIIERKDGSLECLDSQFNRAISRDGGRTWGEYRKFEELAQSIQDGGAFGFGWIRLPSGGIGMGWTEWGTLTGNHQWVKTLWRTSSDEGETWSEPVLVNPTGDQGMPSHLSPVFLTSTGRLVMPTRTCVSAGMHIHDTIQLGTGWWKGKNVEIEGHGHWPEWDMSYCCFSDDEGKTWSRCEGYLLGWLYRGYGNFVSTDEPAAAELKDGRLLMLMRTTLGRLLQSFSEDGGEHWSLPEPSPLAGSYAPCVLRKIPQTGDLLCVWNQVSADEIRQGRQRGRLSAAITSDGQTWNHFRTIERYGRMNEADRIEPEDPLLLCRSLDDVGELPADRGLADYATIAFHKAEVILAYPTCRGAVEDLVSAMKIRVLPLEWFYDGS